MLEIKVIGPVDGVYHLGYQTKESAKFYSINEFVSKELANAAAWLMNRERARNQGHE